MRADQLRIGESFEIPALLDLLQNLVCLRVSASAVCIDGEILDDDTREWRRIKPTKTERYIAPSCEVRPLDKPLVDVATVNFVTKIESPLPAREKKPRKTRTKTAIEFPDRPFIIPKLAKELGCSTTKIFSEIKELLKRDKIKIVKTVRGKHQRGRGTKVYQII